MKIKSVNMLLTVLALVLLPQCRSTENQFTVSPDVGEPLTEFSSPIDRGSDLGSGFGSSSGSSSGSGSSTTPDSSSLNISSPELRAFMLSEGKPSEWGTVGFERVVKIAEFFCSDCHTATIWYGDSSTREFYRSRDVKGRVEKRTMPSPASSYSKLMDEAEEAGYDYRSAMIRYLSK